MKKYTKLFSLIAAGVFIFAYIFRIIDISKGLEALEDPVYSYADFLTKYAEAMHLILVLDIIIVILLMLMCLLSTAFTFRFDSKVLLHNGSMIVLTVAMIEKIYILVAGYELSNAYFIPFDMPASTIAIISILGTGLLCAITSMFIREFVKSDTPSGVLSIFAVVCLITAMIVGFASGSSSKNIISVLFDVFSILGAFLMIGQYVTYFIHPETHPVKEEKVVEIKKVEVKEKPVKKVEVKDDDIMEKLSYLKSLFEKDLISEEEYKQKRQKYVDKL